MRMPEVMKNDKAWNPPPAGSKEREEWPAHAFLDPENKRYPYKKYVDGEWKVSCAGLLAAYRRAIMSKEQSIAAKARALAERYKCPWATK
jgi:hypothetical protein